MRTTVVIPTYNERENLRPLVERIAAFRIPSCEILIVDDGSPDGTGALADALASRYPVRVLHRPRKEGLGAAYVAGFHDALAHGAEVIVQMDADGSHDAAEIPPMLALLAGNNLPPSSRASDASREIPLQHGHPNGISPLGPMESDLGRNDGGMADLVVGSRRARGGRIIDWAWHRRAVSWAAQWFARTLLGFRTRDITGGFRVWRAETLRAALAGALPTRGYAFQEMMLAHAERAGARIIEHPITFRDRTAGQSKLGRNDILEFFHVAIRSRWYSGRITHHERDPSSGTPRGDDGEYAVVTWSRLPRSERRFALLVAAALIVLTGFPYLYGWLRTPPEYVYTGVHALSPVDSAVYRSFIEQIRDGHTLVVSLFSAEPNRIPTLQLFWLPVGLLARALALPAALAIHLVRLALITPFMMLLAVLVATLIREPIAGWPVRALRRLALLLIAFSSGIGALAAGHLTAVGTVRDGYAYLPVDLWVPEANTFLTMLQFPHMVASLALLMMTILALARFQHTLAWRWSIAGGIAAGALVAFHPYYVLTVVSIPFVWAISETTFRRAVAWRSFAHGAITAALAAPGTLYRLWLLFADPVVASHAAQNILTTPTPLLVALGYGALIPFAVIGLASRRALRTPELRLLAVWIVTTLVLAYTPVPWQRKLLEGLHVGLAIAAAIGIPVALAWVRRVLPERMRRIVWSRATALWIAIPLFGFSTFAVLVQDLAFFTVQFPSHIPATIVYYPNTSIDAMRWIRSRTTRTEDATLALGIDGAYFPMYTARTSVIGTPHETKDFMRKQTLVRSVTHGDLSPTNAAAALDQLRVRYILVTPAEAHRWRIDPTNIPGVHLVYNHSGVRVYAVAHPLVPMREYARSCEQ